MTKKRTGRARSSVSRRQVLRWATATGALGAGLVAGNRSIFAQTSGTPRAGGVLKLGMFGTPKRIDPSFAVVAEEFMLTQALYDNLTRLDADLKPQPQLATEWQPSENGAVWTFKLRQGVKFHHGREFTAEDVVFTFERVIDPKSGSAGRRGVGPIEKIEAVDKHTVRFKLTQAYVDMPEIMGGSFARIVPADRGDKLDTEPLGTGPFRMADFRPGEATRMVKFADYWDKGRPHLDELWQVNIPQAAAQVASLSGGEIHAMFEVPGPFVGALEKNQAVNLIQVRSPAFQPVSMMTTEKPFDDVRVRRAMKYLVDRQTIIQTVWQGRAIPAYDHPVPSFHPFFAATTPEFTYDVAKAKALLAEAGYPNGFSLELWTSNERVGLQELAVAVQRMAEPAGVKLEIKTVPWSVFTANVWKKKPFYCSNWFGRPTIDDMLFPFFHSTGGFNEGQFSNPDIDKLLEAGRAETDLTKRKEIYAKVLQAVHNDGYMIIALHSSFVTAMRKNVKNQAVHPLRLWDSRWTYLES